MIQQISNQICLRDPGSFTWLRLICHLISLMYLLCPKWLWCYWLCVISCGTFDKIFGSVLLWQKKTAKLRCFSKLCCLLFCGFNANKWEQFFCMREQVQYIFFVLLKNTKWGYISLCLSVYLTVCLSIYIHVRTHTHAHTYIYIYVWWITDFRWAQPLLCFNALCSQIYGWMSQHTLSALLQRCPPSFVSDLFSDLGDGSQLLDLLEVMSDQPLVSNNLIPLYSNKSVSWGVVKMNIIITTELML